MSTTIPPPQGVMAEVVAFLLGEGELDGLWFGDETPRARYWWRNVLRPAFATLSTEVEALRASGDAKERDWHNAMRRALDAESRATALLARCEGLEAELSEAREVLAAVCDEKKWTPTDSALWPRIRDTLAATRTTGGDAP